MKNGQRAARGGYRGKPSFTAELGARHPIFFEDNDKLDQFFGLLGSKIRKIVPDIHETVPDPNDPEQLQEKITPRHVLYSARDKIGMTVMEKRITRRYSKRNRLHWNKSDVGRLRQEIGNRLDHLEIVTDDEGTIPVPLKTVVQAGDGSSNNQGRKLAAIVDPTSRAAEFLLQEHEIIVDCLAGSLRDFEYPYDDYVPKMTVGRIDRVASPEQMERCVMAAQSLLPVTVHLQPIKFFAYQEI